MIALIWWSSADARSLPDAASRGELYASRLNGVDFWTHVTEADLARAAGRAQGHPMEPQAAADRVVRHLSIMFATATTGAAETPGSSLSFRALSAKHCHLCGYAYVLVTAIPSPEVAATSPADIVRCVVYADGEVGTLVPQSKPAMAAAATPVAVAVAAVEPVAVPLPALSATSPAQA